MVMAKISFSKLWGNLASANIALKMNDIELPGEEHFIKKMDELIESCKPDKSVSVAYLVLNAYSWGQNYKLSLDNQEKRSE